MHAGVDGHVVHALLGLLFDHFEHELGGEILGALDAGEGFVDGHGADGNGRGFDDGLADRGDVAAGGKIHHGVRAVVHGAVQLLEFLGDLGGDRGIADIGVDLAAEGDADAHGLERAMIDIGGDDGAAAGDFAAHQFGLDLFAPGDILHLFGDDALAREVHLRNITRAIGGGALRQPLFDPGISDGHEVTPLFRLGTHYHICPPRERMLALPTTSRRSGAEQRFDAFGSLSDKFS